MALLWCTPYQLLSSFYNRIIDRVINVNHVIKPVLFNVLETRDTNIESSIDKPDKISIIGDTIDKHNNNNIAGDTTREYVSVNNAGINSVA